MRKIEKLLRAAWLSGETINISNSQVRYNAHYGLYELVLFGNVIAWRNHNTGAIAFTMCDWNTNTTRSRLSNVAFPIGVSIGTSKGVAQLWSCFHDSKFHRMQVIDPKAYYIVDERGATPTDTLCDIAGFNSLAHN